MILLSSRFTWKIRYNFIDILNVSNKVLTQKLFSLDEEINDTHREKLVLYRIQYKNYLKCKVGCFRRFSYVYTINQDLLIPLSYRCLKNVIHQIDSKNEWLLLSVTFTVKFELVFVLTLVNAFSRVFILKLTERA